GGVDLQLNASRQIEATVRWGSDVRYKFDSRHTKAGSANRRYRSGRSSRRPAYTVVLLKSPVSNDAMIDGRDKTRKVKMPRTVPNGIPRHETAATTRHSTRERRCFSRCATMNFRMARTIIAVKNPIPSKPKTNPTNGGGGWFDCCARRSPADTRTTPINA